MMALARCVQRRGEGGWATYVSNANRQDMISALREMANNLELEADIPPLHGEGPGPDYSGGEAM